MLSCMAQLVQAMAGSDVIVRYAHMELAEPSITAGVTACVMAGATEIIAFPYMLSPGRHSTGDIPRLVAAAAAPYPGVTIRVTPAFGVHERLGQLILDRAGLHAAHVPSGAEGACCWNPEGTHQACGDGCRALDSERRLPSPPALSREPA